MEYLTLQDVPRYHRTTVSYPRHSSELAPIFLEAGASTATRLPRMSEVSPNGSFATNPCSLPINSIASPTPMDSPASASSSLLSSPAPEPARPHERYDSVIEPLEATKLAPRADTVQQRTLPPLPAYPEVRSSMCPCKCSCSETPSYYEHLESSYQFQRHQAGYPRNSSSDRDQGLLPLPPVRQLIHEVDRRRPSKPKAREVSLAPFASSSMPNSTDFPGSHDPFKDDNDARRKGSKRHRESLQPSSYTYTSLPEHSLDRPQFPQVGPSFNAPEYQSSAYNSPRTVPLNNSPPNRNLQSLQPRSPPSSLPTFPHGAPEGPSHTSETRYQSQSPFEPSTTLILHRPSFPTGEQVYGAYIPVSPRAKDNFCMRTKRSFHSSSSEPYYGPRHPYYPGEITYPLGNGDTPVQNRKRRGNLPKEATQILKNWFFAHQDSPYPSEDEKCQFAKQTGLHMAQISNWFINARRRQPEKLGKVDNKAAQQQLEGQALPHSRTQAFRRAQKQHMMSRENLAVQSQNTEQKSRGGC